MKPKVITIFGSSQVKANHPQYAKAVLAGKLLAQKGFIVCNGGYSGIMEASARGACEAGGKTLGVTTRQFGSVRCNHWIQKEKRMKTWKDRLFGLIEAGDGYLVFEGGTGTLVELACVWEMMQKGLMTAKPTVLLGSSWKKMVDFLSRSPEMERSCAIHYESNPVKAVHILNQAFMA